MKNWFRDERQEEKGFKGWVKAGWPDIKANRWNFLGLGIGSAVGGVCIIFLTNFLGNSDASPLAVISVAAGLIAFLGAVLRVIAHLDQTTRGKAVDMTGKALAMTATLQVGLLGLYELGLLPTGA